MQENTVQKSANKGTVIASVTTASMFAGILLIPLLLQEVLHYSALATGLILLPQALAMGLAMTVGVL